MLSVTLVLKKVKYFCFNTPHSRILDMGCPTNIVYIDVYRWKWGVMYSPIASVVCVCERDVCVWEREFCLLLTILYYTSHNVIWEPLYLVCFLLVLSLNRACALKIQKKTQTVWVWRCVSYLWFLFPRLLIWVKMKSIASSCLPLISTWLGSQRQKEMAPYGFPHPYVWKLENMVLQ